MIEGVKSNSAYIGGGQQINLLTRHGRIEDIANASDLPNIKAMRENCEKVLSMLAEKHIFARKCVETSFQAHKKSHFLTKTYFNGIYS